MNLGIIIAIISPIIYAFVNIFDKFTVSHKVKNPLGYSAVAGIAVILFGIILTSFLNWDNVNFSNLLFPALAGIISGFLYYFYFFIMKKSDASYVIGFVYLFPVVVAILSFIFLNERLPILSYLAIFFILTGIILLSIRAKKVKAITLFLLLGIYILLLGGYEFFIKVSTNNLTFMQGLAVTTLVSGIIVLLGLFSRKIRKEFVIEIKNIKYAFISEFITLIGALTLFLAMSLMSATIVSAIASIQPLAVLIFEAIAHRLFGKMTKDTKLLPKLIAILFIVIGVIMLSIVSS